MNLENSENWRCTMRNINYGGARIQLAGALKLVPSPKISGTGRWPLLGVSLLVFLTSALRALEEPLQVLVVRTLASILVPVRSNTQMLQGDDSKVKAMNALGRAYCRARVCRYVEISVV